MKDPKFYVGIVIGLSMSLVLLSIGFFVGPAYTAPTIGTDDIEDNAIISQKIKDSEVKSQDLANGAVTGGKISPFALKLVTTQKSVYQTVSAHSTAFATAQCNRGEVVTGGGYWYGGGLNGAYAYLNKPVVSLNEWMVQIDNPTDASESFMAFVVCAHLQLGP
jgi:hypothetical protein